MDVEVSDPSLGLKQVFVKKPNQAQATVHGEDSSSRACSSGEQGGTALWPSRLGGDRNGGPGTLSRQMDDNSVLSTAHLTTQGSCVAAL